MRLQLACQPTTKMRDKAVSVIHTGQYNALRGCMRDDMTPDLRVFIFNTAYRPNFTHPGNVYCIYTVMCCCEDACDTMTPDLRVFRKYYFQHNLYRPTD